MHHGISDGMLSLLVACHRVPTRIWGQSGRRRRCTHLQPLHAWNLPPGRQHHPAMLALQGQRFPYVTPGCIQLDAVRVSARCVTQRRGPRGDMCLCGFGLMDSCAWAATPACSLKYYCSTQNGTCSLSPSVPQVCCSCHAQTSCRGLLRT